MIQMQDIQRVYNTGKVRVEALKSIQLTVDEGEFVAIMGPSGSGKSTLMNILGCLDKPTGGQYLLAGENVGDMDDDALADIRNRRVGFIFQNFNLLPYATAYENVELPMIFAGVNTRERRKRVTDLLELVGLGNRMNHKPNELSGGQQQRVAIARSLVNKPAIIMADEPTGNLDSHSSEEIMGIFVDLWKQGNTILMITHDPNITQYCERVIRLVDGQIASSETMMIEDQLISA
ncbi:MAG: ABC transporter ATP-binding protein [Lentisphaeria bacterium]|nr:ABC transporter ATP-binding protein [Candidatus Neomarinimicrobiota bacterium]MCF7841679.1 ABC transporter ATP-binding protein [Lentisphaeria bacterium]